jgi:hypothetical protein
MRNVDMNVAEFYEQTNSKQYNLYDAYSQANTSPPSDTSLGGSDDLINRSYSVVNGKPVITYTRLLNTNDRYDKELSLVRIFNYRIQIHLL